ncbi:MAG: PAS domain S-box protein, partial [Candidatus Eremiobacteraeota bacterium]|nr:PAS domain S-box protein [Candidatus Eremiobacteraeota bacterium]
MKPQLELGDLLRSLYEGNPDAVVVYDADGRFVATNTAGHELAGFSAAELACTTFSEHVFAPERARANEVMATTLGGGV